MGTKPISRFRYINLSYINVRYAAYLKLTKYCMSAVPEH